MSCIFSQLPRFISCCVSLPDSVQTESLHKRGRLLSTDPRYTMLHWMFHERKLHLEWFYTIDGGGGDRPQLVIPVTRRLHYIVCIYLAEYYSDFLGEPKVQLVREFSAVTPLHENKLVCEY